MKIEKSPVFEPGIYASACGFSGGKVGLKTAAVWADRPFCGWLARPRRELAAAWFEE